ncbi:uncharacterized protein PHACADRAFT_258073 [Phanerochaete carnosa HHB-10118-sp]|uniref:Uncharacterized protein n=1 Tax=Phanerochaete carnosa (strain HHB-10118-sp) TaxID=650164 RepID=K5W5U0_PHACS|nr:uncharacterized protein PHACADRAFT_258073 [Phanerochaete carnosa HHB-10118-sp]EKM54299.1 hypothetical protein PHACADRAFT_258073 [Phanerochaete carnosa HHB-10118-sp]
MKGSLWLPITSLPSCTLAGRARCEYVTNSQTRPENRRLVGIPSLSVTATFSCTMRSTLARCPSPYTLRPSPTLQLDTDVAVLNGKTVSTLKTAQESGAIRTDHRGHACENTFSFCLNDINRSVTPAWRQAEYGKVCSYGVSKVIFHSAMTYAHTSLLLE